MEDTDQLPKKARELMSRLAEQVVALRATRSPSAQKRQSSLPQISKQKVSIKAEPLKKIIETSKDDFFSRRGTSHEKLRFSQRRQEPIAKQFEIQMDKILRTQSRRNIRSKIENKLQKILEDELPSLPSDLRQIKQYETEMSKSRKKSRLLDVNIDLNQLAISRFSPKKELLTETDKPFSIPLFPTGMPQPPKYATYHTKSEDVQMAYETLQEKQGKKRIRFVNGFEKWIKQSPVKLLKEEQQKKQPIIINETLVERVIESVKKRVKIENTQLRQQLKENYEMSMEYFRDRLEDYGLDGVRQRIKVTKPIEREMVFDDVRKVMQKTTFGSENMNFVHKFGLLKHDYLHRVTKAYEILNRVRVFQHFSGFLDNFSNVIQNEATVSERLNAYFFKKRQQFQLLIYQLQDVINGLEKDLKQHIQQKIRTNSRFEAIPYKQSISQFIQQFNIRLNILLRSNTLFSILNSLRQLDQYYSMDWQTYTIPCFTTPKAPICLSMFEMPHPKKFKPLIQLQLQYKKVKRIKKKNTYKYLQQMRTNLKDGKMNDQPKVYCKNVQEIQQQFEHLFTKYMSDISKLENINGCIQSHTIGQIETPETQYYKQRIKSRIGNAYTKVHNICGYLSNYQHYLTDKSYLDQLLQLFQKINGCQLVIDEIRNMQCDKEYITLIPNTIYSDLLQVTTKQLKDRIVLCIDNNISRLLKACQLKFNTISDRIIQRVVTIEGRVDGAFGNIDVFLTFYEYFKDKSIQVSTNMVASDLLIANRLYTILQDNKAVISSESLKKYLTIQTGLFRMEKARIEAKKKLANASEMFVSAIKDTKHRIFARLQKMLKELLEISKISDMQNYRKNASISKAIYEELKDLCEVATGINKKQIIFGLPQSNFSIFYKQFNHFIKYERLWDYIEKLKQKQSLKKLTVANFHPQDLMSLIKQGQQVIYYIRKNTVNKRLLSLTDQVYKDLLRLLPNCHLLTITLSPCFTQTQWISLFKQVFPEQQKFPSFYEMSITQFENTNILSHPDKVYKYYRQFNEEYQMAVYPAFFQYTLSHLQFQYETVQDTEVILISRDSINMVKQLKFYFEFIATIYRNNQIDGIVTFLKNTQKAMEQMHILLPLLKQLWAILDIFTQMDDYIVCRDTVIFVMDEYAKKSEAIKRFNMYFFYQDKTRLTFSESLNKCNMVKVTIINSMNNIKKNYEFLNKFKNQEIYNILVSCREKHQLDEMMRQYFLNDVSHIDMDMGKNEIWLNRIETKYGEQLDFGLKFILKKQDSFGVFQMVKFIVESVGKVIRYETINCFKLTYCYHFDVVQLYQYYSGSHTPLQCLMLSMYMAFSMVLPCICQSKSDLQDFRMWLVEKVQSKGIPSEPMRKEALDNIIGLIQHFIEAVTQLEMQNITRQSSIDYIKLPKLTILKEHKGQLQKWVMKTKENMEEHQLLFLKAHKSPIFYGIQVLETYKHQSNLGADLKKIVTIKDIKNIDVSIGWQAYGMTIPYGCQLTEVRIPTMQDMMILSQYILTHGMKQILVTTHNVLPFLLGKTIQDVTTTEQLTIASQYNPTNLHQSQFSMKTLNKLSDLPPQSLKNIIITCPTLKRSQLRHLPSNIIKIARFTIKPTFNYSQLTNQPNVSIEQLETLQHGMVISDQFQQKIKNITIIDKITIHHTDNYRLHNTYSDAIAMFQHQTGITWDNSLKLQCLIDNYFMTNSIQAIRCLSYIQYKRHGNFNVIYVPLTQYKMEDILGHYTYNKTELSKKKQPIRQAIWKKGIIQKLLTNQHIDGITEGANWKQTTKNTNYDWYVLQVDTTILEWFINSISKKKYTFQKTYSTNIQNKKIIFKVNNISNLPISIVSLPFSVMNRNKWSVNISYKLTMWRYAMKDETIQPYVDAAIKICQKIFQKIQKLQSQLSLQQHLQSFFHLLTIFINQTRKFYIAQGFYNYGDLTDQDKKVAVSPSDLRSCSIIKDDVEQLHEIAKQEKQLENTRKMLYKDLNSFMEARKVEEQSRIVKMQPRFYYSVQSAVALSFYWSFNTQKQLLQALEQSSREWYLEHTAYNLDRLASHPDFNLRYYGYSMQKQSWFLWEEIPIPTVNAISSSVSSRVLAIEQIVRLNPHSQSLEYIKQHMNYMNNVNNFFEVQLNLSSASSTEYLVKYLIAYNIPTHLLSSNHKFTMRLANQLKKYNNNRVLTVTRTDNLKTYLMDKCTYKINGFTKAKSKYQLPEVSRKLCLFVEDVSMDQLSLVRSMVTYKMINFRRIDDFSIVMSGQIAPDHMVQNSCIIQHIDCQPSVYLTIFNNISQGFKPNQLNVFRMLLSPQSRNYYESIKLFKSNIETFGLVFGVGECQRVGELKKMVESKIKQQIDYYKFLKGEAMKDFNKEERPFEVERVDRERDILKISRAIDEEYQNIVRRVGEVNSMTLTVPRYLSISAQSPRTKNKSVKEMCQIEEPEMVVKQLSHFLLEYMKYLHYSDNKIKRILKMPNLVNTLCHLVDKIQASQQKYYTYHSNYPEAASFILNAAIYLVERQKGIAGATFSELKIVEGLSTISPMIQQAYTFLNNCSFSQSVCINLDKQQSMHFHHIYPNDLQFIKYIIVDKSKCHQIYKGNEQLYKMHMVSQMRQRIYWCLSTESDGMQLPTNIFNITESTNTNIEQSYECLFFDKAYEVYEKWMKILKKQPYPPKTLQTPYKQVNKALLEWFKKRQRDTEDNLSYIKQIRQLFQARLETLKQQAQQLKIDLRAKMDSKQQTEQEIKENNKFMNESETMVEQLKKEAEESTRIRKNTENQKRSYNGLEMYQQAKFNFKFRAPRKILEKQVLKDSFYDKPLMVYYVYLSNILTDGNFISQKYWQIMDNTYKPDIMYSINEQQKKAFIKSVTYGRLFIIAQTQVIESLPAQQIRTAKKLRSKFQIFKQMNQQNKQRQKRQFGEQQRYDIVQQLADQLELLQDMSQLQRAFAQYIAYCYRYRKDTVSMDKRIIKHTKNAENCLERIKMTRQAVKTKKVQQNKLVDKLKILLMKISETENDINVNAENTQCLETVYKDNMKIIEPNFYYDGTHIFPDGVARTFQALLLTSIIVTGLCDYENVIVGEICSGMAQKVEREQLEMATNWIYKKMYIRLLDQKMLLEICKKQKIITSGDFWQHFFRQLLRRCGEEVVIDGVGGATAIQKGGVNKTSATILNPPPTIYVNTSNTTLSQYLASHFDNQITKQYELLVDRLLLKQQQCNLKYTNIMERIANINLKKQQILSLQLQEWKLTQIDKPYSVDNRDPPEYAKIQQQLNTIDNIVDMTIQICLLNNIYPSRTTFTQHFIRIHRQLKYQHSSYEQYFSQLVLKFITGQLNYVPPRDIYHVAVRQTQNKRIVSDFEQLNDIARKYEEQLENATVSRSLLEVSLIGDIEKKKQEMYRRLQSMSQQCQAVNIHQFDKRTDCKIVRLSKTEESIVYDMAIVQLEDRKMVEPLARQSLLDHPQYNLVDVDEYRGRISTVECYVPSEILRLVCRDAHKMYSERASLRTVVELEQNKTCIIANGENNIHQLLIEYGVSGKITGQVTMDCVIVQLDGQDLENIMKTLTQPHNQRIYFIIYTFDDSYVANYIRQHIQYPIYSVKKRNNIQSVLLSQQPKIASKVSNQPIQQIMRITRHPNNISSLWLPTTKPSPTLDLKLYILSSILNVRSNILQTDDSSNLSFIVNSNLPLLHYLHSHFNISMPQAIQKISEQTNCRQTLNEIVQLLHLDINNIIYEYQNGLLKILSDYQDFLTMVSKMPQYDSPEMLRLLECHMISWRAYRNINVMQKVRREKQLIECPELRQYFKGILIRQFKLEFSQFQQTIVRPQSSQPLNVEFLSKVEPDIPSMSKPQTYSLLFKMMKMVKQMRKNRFKGTKTMKNIVKTNQVVPMIHVVKMAIRNQINYINKHDLYAGKITKKQQYCGQYVRRLYEEVAGGLEQTTIDVGKMNQPTFLFMVLQLVTAQSNGKDMYRYKLVLSESGDGLVVKGLRMRNAKMEDGQVVLSACRWNDMAPLAIQVRERHETAYKKNKRQIVWCFDDQKDLECHEQGVAKITITIGNYTGILYARGHTKTDSYGIQLTI